MTDDYANAAVHRVLAQDDIAELGIDVICRGDRVVLRGTVESEHRRDEIARRVTEFMPGRRLLNEITVVRAEPPDAAEELS